MIFELNVKDLGRRAIGTFDLLDYSCSAYDVELL